METISHHLLVEVNGVSSELLDSLDDIQRIFLKSVEVGGATYINHHFHKFSPIGISGVVVIAESHISIHTWPEHKYAALDVFTCGNKEIADNILKFILDELSPVEYQIRYILRGTP